MGQRIVTCRRGGASHSPRRASKFTVLLELNTKVTIINVIPYVTVDVGLYQIQTRRGDKFRAEISQQFRTGLFLSSDGVKSIENDRADHAMFVTKVQIGTVTFRMWAGTWGRIFTPA